MPPIKNDWLPFIKATTTNYFLTQKVVFRKNVPKLAAGLILPIIWLWLIIRSLILGDYTGMNIFLQLLGAFLLMVVVFGLVLFNALDKEKGVFNVQMQLQILNKLLSDGGYAAEQFRLVSEQENQFDRESFALELLKRSGFYAHAKFTSKTEPFFGGVLKSMMAVFLDEMASNDIPLHSAPPKIRTISLTKTQAFALSGTVSTTRVFSGVVLKMDWNSELNWGEDEALFICNTNKFYPEPPRLEGVVSDVELDEHSNFWIYPAKLPNFKNRIPSSFLLELQRLHKICPWTSKQTGTFSTNSVANSFRVKIDRYGIALYIENYTNLETMAFYPPARANFWEDALWQYIYDCDFRLQWCFSVRDLNVYLH